MTRDELEALDPKKTKTIEIEDFVDLDQIDPIYFNQPYYVGPAPGAERAYALLAQAMYEQRKVAIARFVMRNKESLAAIRASADGDVLTLATMRFADEVVPPEQLGDALGEVGDVEPKDREVEMAKALIESLSNDFDPDSYEDSYRAELLELIERKAVGREDRLRRDRGAGADQGARPDGGARGVARRDQGRGAERRRRDEESPSPASKPKSSSSKLEVQVVVLLEGEEQVAGQGREVEVDGRRLSITNLDKVLYPRAGSPRAR